MEQENSLIPEEEIKNPEILETSTNDEPVVAESKAVENAKENFSRQRSKSISIPRTVRGYR